MYWNFNWISVQPNTPFCFNYLALILIFHAQQVVEDFASENVIYLELRTTPKVLI